MRSNSHPLGDPAELAALYLAGSFTREECSLFEAHLKVGCARCEKELSDLRALDIMADLIEPIEPHPAILRSLMERVHQDIQSTERRSSANRAHPGTKQSLASQWIVQRANEGEWLPLSFEGIELRILYRDKERRQLTCLVRMAPGASYPEHRHEGAEECLVLEGDLQIGDVTLNKGDFQRPPGYLQAPQRTHGGCLLLLTSPMD